MRTKPILKTCCLCQSLRTGSIIAGVLAIILSIATIFLIIFVPMDFNTFLLNWIPSLAKKIILYINLVMTILISTLMIIGVIKRNQYCMIPWVVLGIILVIGMFISIIWNAIVLWIDGLVWEGFVWLIIGLLVGCLYTYMWMVVYSYLAELREEERRGKYAKQPYRR